MSLVPVPPTLRSPRHITLNDRVGLIEWSYVSNDRDVVVGLQCVLKYSVGEDPRKISIGVALDSGADVWNVIEQDATVVALRETLEDPARDVPMFGYLADR